jgi:hypothetical protein
VVPTPAVGLLAVAKRVTSCKRTRGGLHHEPAAVPHALQEGRERQSGERKSKRER